MTDLNQALTEIQLIRSQIARGSEFRGYGPTTNAATGVLALMAAFLQMHWLSDPTAAALNYLTLWVATAAVSLVLVSIETGLRCRRMHSPLAMEMIHSALEHFLPAIVAGFLLTVVLWRYVPDNLWMLPGLWQIVFSMGVFASCQFLPRPMFIVGVWYLGTGLACLAIGRSQAFSPWEMGIPYCVGQLLVATVLQFGYRKADEY
jgi:hypothetical protein